MIGSGSGPMPGAEVYDSELLGAQKAMEEVIKKANGGPAKVLLDNPNATRALRSGRTRLSQSVVDKFTTQTGQFLSVKVCWIPGHSGISGNKQAGKLAKAALRDILDLRDE